MGYDGMTDRRRGELDNMFPGGWDIAHTRADADKLYAGGITAVRPAGGVWPDEQDGPEDGSECSECLAIIPDAESGSLANRHHEVSCSLYDATRD